MSSSVDFAQLAKGLDRLVLLMGRLSNRLGITEKWPFHKLNNDPYTGRTPQIRNHLNTGQLSVRILNGDMSNTHTCHMKCPTISILDKQWSDLFTEIGFIISFSL